MYRNPIVLFGFGPIYLVLISGRFNRKDARKKERNNTYLSNALIVLFYGTIAFFVGWQSFLIVQVVSMYIAAALGIWLFRSEERRVGKECMFCWVRWAWRKDYGMV